MPREFGISIINVPVSPMNRVVTFSGGPKGLGHIVVTKGIIRGLKAVQCPFNFNPASEEEVYPIGFFTYQIECGLHLEQLIDFKNRGVIEKILGYGIIHEEFFEKYYDEIDTLFMASPWKTKDKAISCPISANMDLFKRSTPALQNKRVTVYIKHYDFNEKVLGAEAPVINLLQEKGIEPLRVAYGLGDLAYTHEAFLEILDQSSAVIVLDTSECQGIFYNECWSMDIPTFVYDVYDLEGTERHNPIRSSPYLSRDNGAAWRSIDDLSTLLDEYYSGELTFSPRQWCENNISDITVGKTILKAALSPEAFMQWENEFQKKDVGMI